MFGLGRRKRQNQPMEVTMEKSQLHRQTRTRKMFALTSSFLFLIAIIFLILVEVAMTSPSRLPNVFFIKLDLTNIVPTSVPNYRLINSVAQSLGLHDYYQVGLWNWCASYRGSGIDSCSTPKTLFWFNPIEVIQGELLAGASIAIPSEVNNILDILRVASNWMFGLFLTGAVLSFLMIFITPLAIYSRLLTIITFIGTLLAALTTTVATVLATAIFVIFRNAARSQTQINLGASVGVEMFAFMWVAAGATLFAFVIQLCLLCCCRSRRKARREWRKSHEGVRRSVDGASEKEDSSSAH